MGKAAFVVSISVTIQRFFVMPWSQKLDTFIYYQWGLNCLDVLPLLLFVIVQ